MSNLSVEIVSRVSRDFEEKGYAIIENFLDNEEIESLRKEAVRLIKEESTKGEHGCQIFSNENNARSLYFMTSGDKVRFFFEKNAFAKKDDCLELLVPEEQSLAKIGHALHYFNDTFRKITCNQKVQDVFKAISFQQPTVVQSMVIFKNPKVGGAYTPHQDASFLCTEPIYVAGIWLALDDATKENGCLEFIPGSHKNPLLRRNIRTGVLKDGEQMLEWNAPVNEYKDSEFVLEPVKKGSLVLIHGLVIHRSAPNESENPRWIYTFHVYDKKRAQYQEDNWLQTGENPNTFLSIYES